MINPIKAVRALVSANVQPKINPEKWDKYVNISRDLDGDVFNYVSGIKSTLGNYAQKKRFKISIYPAVNEITDKTAYAGSNLEKQLSKRFAVKVEDDSFGKSKIALFDSNWKKAEGETPLSRKIFQMIGGSRKIGQHEAVLGVKDLHIKELEKEFFGL